MRLPPDDPLSTPDELVIHAKMTHAEAKGHYGDALTVSAMRDELVAQALAAGATPAELATALGVNKQRISHMASNGKKEA